MPPLPKASLEEWMPHTLNEARRLYNVLIERGRLSPMAARLFIGRLQTVPLRGPFSKGQQVELAKLRRVLATLGEPPWEPDRAPLEGDLGPLSSEADDDVGPGGTALSGASRAFSGLRAA